MVYEKKWDGMCIGKAGIILINKKDEVLLIHQKQSNKWGFPKGGIEKENNDSNVDPFKIAKKELKEETGVDIDEIEYKIQSKINYIMSKQMNHFYVIKTEKMVSVDDYDKDEINDYKWVKIEELAKMNNTNYTIKPFINFNKRKVIITKKEKEIKKESYVPPHMRRNRADHVKRW